MEGNIIKEVTVNSTNELKTSQGIYNINGQLVGNTSPINKLKPGIYITDGRVIRKKQVHFVKLLCENVTRSGG